jgi:hypothetical protein
MVKPGNKRFHVTLTANNVAKIEYIKEKLGVKDSSLFNLAIDYYHELLRRNK